jgi:hypothetical protein
MREGLDKWSPSAWQAIWFAAGGALVFIGQEFSVPAAADVGIVVLGTLMIAVGIDIIIKKLGVFRGEGWVQGNVVDVYRALAEVLWAGVFIIGGLAAAAVVLVKWLVPSTPDTFWTDVLGSSTAVGAFLGIVGLMILLDGLIRAIVGSGRVDPRRFGGLPHAFDRMVGAMTFLVGLGMAVLGLVLLVRPGLVTTVLEQLRNQLGGS